MSVEKKEKKKKWSSIVQTQLLFQHATPSTRSATVTRKHWFTSQYSSVATVTSTSLCGVRVSSTKTARRRLLPLPLLRCRHGGSA